MSSKKNTTIIKTKVLILLIIICSLISGLISTFLLLYFNKQNITTNVQTKESIKVTNNEKQTGIKNLENQITNLVKKTSPSVVSIIIKKDLILYRSDPWGFFYNPISINKREAGGGTGIFITRDGKIITNKHVVSDSSAQYTIITNKNKEYDAEILAISESNDLAILQVISTEKNFTKLHFIKKVKNIKVGQFAIAIGNALSEFQNSVSLGVVSGKNRNIKDGNNILGGLIQSDTAITSGNSGGPLINLEGRVMGINTAVINGSIGIGFSITVTEEKLNYILSSIEKSGEIKTPFVGINYISITPGIKKEFGLSTEHGLYIIDEQGSIISGSPADKIGIEPGDILIEANGNKLINSNDLNLLVQNKIPGNIIKFKVLKNNLVIKEYDLILGEK